MLERFFPDDLYKTVQDIEPEYFKKYGIRLVILDIDNTLVPYTVPEPTPAALTFLEQLQKAGISYCFVSNNNKARVLRFNQDLQAFFVARAGKPLTGGIQKALDHFGAKSEETLLIGDQIFTDVYGGRRCGLRTILVEPIEDKETLFFRFKRRMEKIVLKKYRKEKDHV